MEEFIVSQKARDSTFRTEGYIVLSLETGMMNLDSVLFKCDINKNFLNFDDKDNDLLFPDFYTFVAGKPVLIYIKNLGKLIERKFTMESKKNFQSIIEPYLAPKREINFLRSNNPEYFRPDEKIQIHGGITAYIFHDEHKKPQIISSKY